MSNYFLDRNDWRKQAAVTATSDSDIEKAFSDQASGFVENKLAPLMKAPYSIGFEIVRKNDDNTRMVGIFAFKVDENILFAPVFFLNGEIKGPILYRCDTRTFVPANKDWANYLIEAIENAEGKGISISRRGETAPLVQMQRINFLPPGYSKSAAAKCCCCGTEDGLAVNTVIVPKKLAPTPEGNAVVEITTEMANPAAEWNKSDSVRFKSTQDGTIECCCKEAKWNLSVADAASIVDAQDTVRIYDNNENAYELSKEACAEIRNTFFEKIAAAEDWAGPLLQAVDGFMTQPAGLIREFCSEPITGAVACDAIIKAAEANWDFAEMIAYRYNGFENFIPEKMPVETIEKSATAEEKLEISMRCPEDLEKSASYFIDGFVINDTRNPERLTHVIEESPVSIEAPSGPGVYSVLRNDGEFEENVLVTFATGSRVGEEKRPSYCDNEDKKPYMLIKDGKVAFERNVLGIQTGSFNDYKGLKDKVESGKAYWVVVGDTVTNPIYVVSVKNADGVQYARVSSGYSSRSVNKPSNPDGEYLKDVVINYDTEKTVIEEGILGSDVKFIEMPKGDSEVSWIDAKVLTGIGGASSIDKFIYESYKMPKVTVSEDDLDKKAYRISANGETSEAFSKVTMLVKLTQDLCLGADEAYGVMGKVASAGTHSFYLDGMEKCATNLRVVDRPYFDDLVDSDFGIALQPDRVFQLRVHGDQIMEPASAIGDALNPNTGTGLPNFTVATTDPEELRNLADVYKLPNVFEHGAVGTLADTFNALALIEKYVPKLEDAVDSLGRFKFLIYWCPQDFEKAYGADDMVNLEAEIDSNFDDLGGLLLKLLKKTDRQRRGVEDKKTKEDK